MSLRLHQVCLWQGLLGTLPHDLWEISGFSVGWRHPDEWGTIQKKNVQEWQIFAFLTEFMCPFAPALQHQTSRFPSFWFCDLHKGSSGLLQLWRWTSRFWGFETHTAPSYWFPNHPMTYYSFSGSKWKWVDLPHQHSLCLFLSLALLPEHPKHKYPPWLEELPP